MRTGTRRLTNLATTRDGVADVAIIGGGPAGAAAATLLSRWGYDVVVLTRPAPVSRSLAESLPPSIMKPLTALGLDRVVAAAGLLRTCGNTVWWGNGQVRSEGFGDGRYGYQVVRHAFDALLLREAERVGASVRRDTVVRDVSLESAPARLTCISSEGGTDSVEARVVVDCSGRAGVLARHGHRVAEEGFSTLALVGVWHRHEGWDLPDDTHTVVESFADGWAWSVPVSTRYRYVTVMVDPRTTEFDRTGRLEARYRRQLAKARRLWSQIEQARLVCGPWATSASPYASLRPAGPAFLLVGDAASFVDPLSSFGVQKALTSAWLAAVVARTWLLHPEMEGPARDLFVMRETELVQRLRAQAATFFADVARGQPHRFWLARAASAEPLEVAAALEPEIDALRLDPAVRDAFNALKRFSSLDLRRSAHVVVVDHPTVVDDEVVLEPHLIGGTWPQGPCGLQYLRGVDLVRLVDIATSHSQVPDMFEAYQRERAPVPLPDFLGALSVLLGKGVLRNVTG